MIQPTMTQAPRGGGNRSKIRLALMAIILFAMGIAGNAEAAPGYDLVLANGRVIDPASGLDAVRFVGISDGRIATVSETPLDGKDIVDASGLVTAPASNTVMSALEGIIHVLVGGVFVVRNGELVPGVYPGQPIRLKPTLTP